MGSEKGNTSGSVIVVGVIVVILVGNKVADVGDYVLGNCQGAG